MEYIMHNPHEHIIYSKKHISKANESPHKCFFKAGSADIYQTQEYSNLLHTYCYADDSIDLAYRISVTLTSHLFNGTFVDWCTSKKSKTYRISSNVETRLIYTGVLDKNWIRNFYISIVYIIGPPSKLYEYNQSAIKIFLSDSITPRTRHIDVLVSALRDHYFCKYIYICCTQYQM